MRIYPLILCLIVCSCDEKSPDDSKEVVSVATHDFLSPEDLSIQKQRFTARPNRDQVAIFRSSHRSAIDPLDYRTFDQIMWSNGEEVHKDVIIADRTFYVDFPEPEIKTPENIFRRSWRLWAGGYSYDINDYGFVRSKWTGTDSDATGELVYTKKTKSKTEDLVFNFRMFILSLEEAKELHPELNVEREEGTTRWQAAFLVNTDAEQAGTGQPATRPESKSEGSDKHEPEAEGRSQ
jgi:hypothetical protein